MGRYVRQYGFLTVQSRLTYMSQNVRYVAWPGVGALKCHRMYLSEAYVRFVGWNVQVWSDNVHYRPLCDR